MPILRIKDLSKVNSVEDTDLVLLETKTGTMSATIGKIKEALGETNKSQSDWNQNDESAPDYVKNRTHYKKTFEYVIYEGDTTDVNMVPLDYEIPIGTTIEFYNWGVSAGKFETSDFGGGIPGVSISKTGIAVTLYFYNDEKRVQILAYNFSGRLKIVAKDLTAFIPLDEKFIPDTIARKSDIPDTSNLALKTEIPNVDSYITTHNTYTASHNDIRDLITGLTNRLNALADSDDTTLDQLSEIVNYIKSNKELIDAVTTSKVNISDIVDNLTTNVSNKPLSAAQGVALKALIDAIAVPTKVSELSNDSGYITGYTETDPTVPAWAKATTKPSYTKSEVGLSNVDNVKQYSASNPPPYPVTSVNGKTGAVTLDASAVGARPSNWMPSASDVGALPASTTIPSKTSQLTNDSGFIKSYTETDPTVPSWAKAASKPSYNKNEVGLGNVDNIKQYSASNPPPYPVTSVNGKTGAVTVSVPTKVSQLQNDAGYLTEISKEEIVQQVIAALGTPVFGRVDADNNIILTGNLADGTYAIKYEDADGNVTDIGNIVLAPEVTYTNLFDPATATINTRMSGTSSEPKTDNGYVMTALIPIPETAVTKTSTDAFIAVPASMWSASANMFLSKKDGKATDGYCSYSTTKGEVVGAWVKIPLLTEWGTGFTCNGITLSLKVGSSAITASDIQNIEIYFNEIPE